MKVQNKPFRKYYVFLSVFLFAGCASSSFFYPWQQITYSNDTQIKMFKTEMNKDDAISILKIYIRDNPVKRVKETIKAGNYKHSLAIYLPDIQEKIDENEMNESNIIPNTFSLSNSNMILNTFSLSNSSNKNLRQISFQNAGLREMWARRICFSRRSNIVIDKERIAFDDSNECWAFVFGIENQNTYKYDGEDSIVSTHIEYSDVKKIELFECTLLFGSLFYEIVLYDEDNKLMLYFTPPRSGNQMEQVQRLLSALSILMPDVKEDYNDKRFMVNPKFGGQRVDLF